MFGHNEIIGKSYFKSSERDQLLVTSRFFTLQGEGPYSGQPAYFIRLAKCNLACSFCDTYFDSGDWLSFDFLLQESQTIIDNFFASRNINTPNWAKNSNNNPKNIVLVITGGEPSLQKNLANFIKQAEKYFKSTQIETNGTSMLPDLPERTTVVVSPKCLEKNGQVIRFLEPNPKTLERADCLKFVMSAPEHEKYKAYSEIPNWAHHWAQNRPKDMQKKIYISPMNIYLKKPNKTNSQTIFTDQQLDLDKRSKINEVVSFWEPGLLDLEKNQRNHEYAAEYCMKHGYILSLQTHLYASLP